MSDTFILSAGQAHELEMAFARNGWTTQQVKDLTKGDTLAKVRANLFGTTAVDKVLKLASDKIVYTKVKSFDPHAFYTTSETLWVSDFFRDNILPLATKVKNLPAITGKSFELVKNAYDKEITPELPEGYAFEVSELLARIARMIQAQPKGKKDALLNNGFANIFYSAGFAVYVVWLADTGQWCVGAYRRVGGDWGAGGRAFSRN
jgi:hypothetical protein